jgi:hypothetical protein
MQDCELMRTVTRDILSQQEDASHPSGDGWQTITQVTTSIK